MMDGYERTYGGIVKEIQARREIWEVVNLDLWLILSLDEEEGGEEEGGKKGCPHDEHVLEEQGHADD